MPSILGFQAPLLRSVAEQMKLPPITEIARAPGVQDVYRITMHLYDGRACNSVSTLRRSLADGAVLETVYQRALLQKPIIHRIDADRCREFVTALTAIGFDKLPDQPNLPAYHSTDLWLIERAAGTFYKSIILAPELAQETYARLVNAVKHGLPETLRMVK